jgi:hypothetical protein
MPLAGLLLFEAMIVAVGLFVARLLLPRGERHPAELWLPLAFAVGLTVHAMVLMGSLALMGWYSPWHLPVLAVVALVLHGALWRSPRLAPLGGFTFLSRSGAAHTQSFLWLLAFIVLGRIVMLHAEALRFPLFTWDGRFIWNLKAVILFHESTIFTDSFLHQDRVHFHRDYPLLLPGAYLGIYQAAGGVFERMARLFLVHLMTMFLLAFHGAARQRCAPWLAMLFTAILAAAAFRMDYTVRDGITLLTGVADLPMAFFAFMAVVMHGRGWRSRNLRWHLLGGLMTGACLLTKSEGIVALAAIGMGNAVMAIAGRHGAWRERIIALATCAVIPVAVALPWLVLKTHLPNFYDERFADLVSQSGFGPVMDRLPIVVGIVVKELFVVRSWNVLWPLLIVGLCAGLFLRRWRWSWLPGIVVVLWLPAYVLAYLLTPLDIRYHVETSVGRLLSHFHALALLQVAWMLGLWLRWHTFPARNVASARPD